MSSQNSFSVETSSKEYQVEIVIEFEENVIIDEKSRGICKVLSIQYETEGGKDSATHIVVHGPHTPWIVKTIKPANEKKAIKWIMENTKKAD